MAADYEARPHLSSTGGRALRRFAAQRDNPAANSPDSREGPPKRVANPGTDVPLFAFAHISCALHQSLKQQREMPGNGIATFSANPLNHGVSSMRFALPLIAIASLAAPALAAAPQETVSVRVAYDDLDVTSAEGRAALEARIDAKLRQACKLERAARYTYGRAPLDETCFAQARTAALAQVERVAAAEAWRGREVAAN